jgi:hypothetical protein
MLILTRLIGIFIAALGLIFLLGPNLLKQCIGFCQKGKRLYIVGILRVLCGVIFLLAAPDCRLGWVIYILGILTFLKAILIFLLGLERVKSMLDWWSKRPVITVRLLSLIILAMGVLIIYSVS